MQARLARTLVAAAALMLVSSVSATAQTSSETPTFSKDVAPILYKNCVNCHRAGEMAPMSLMTYEEVRPWVRSIRTRVEAGAMPPWHANAPAGTFLNERRLTEAEKDTIVKWATNGAPQGSPSDLPAAPKFTQGWQIGTPDVVLTMAKPFAVPATGTIEYQNIPIPTNFTEDKWVQALEMRTTAPAVVHHILVFGREAADTPDPFRMMPLPNGGNHGVTLPAPPQRPQQAGQGGQQRPQGQRPVARDTLVASLAPGTNTFVFPAGTALKIKAGTTLVFQMHYTAIGREMTDQSSIGFIFAKEPPKQEMRASQFMNPQLFLPAGAANQRVDSMIEFTQDSRIWAMIPHTHLRGKTWQYRMHYPDGRTEVVLDVPKYDFNWQTYYQFARPIVAPKGSRLEAIAHYDNSAANPANPDPGKDVRWGEQTWEEMQYTGISYTVDAPQTPTAQGQQP
jgi:hypothetical protein